MEQLTESFHLEQQDSTATKPRSKRESSLLRAVAELLSKTIAAYPNQTVKDETVDIWTEDWFAIASNQTFEALQAAVERHRRRGDGFIPLVSTLNKLIAEMRQEQRDAAARATVKFVACGKETGVRGKPGWSLCSGGMIMFEAIAYGRPDEDGQRRPMYDGKPQTFAKDCDCLIAWRIEKAKRG